MRHQRQFTDEDRKKALEVRRRNKLEKEEAKRKKRQADLRVQQILESLYAMHFDTSLDDTERIRAAQVFLREKRAVGDDGATMDDKRNLVAELKRGAENNGN